MITPGLLRPVALERLHSGQLPLDLAHFAAGVLVKLPMSTKAAGPRPFLPEF
jgi:hypothetical protein